MSKVGTILQSIEVTMGCIGARVLSRLMKVSKQGVEVEQRERLSSAKSGGAAVAGGTGGTLLDNFDWSCLVGNT